MLRHFWAMTAFSAALISAGASDVGPEIPFEFREGLLWIKACVAQSPEPLNLLIDTGAGVSVINRATADRLKLKRGSPIAVRGVETTFCGYRLKGISVSAGSVALPKDYIVVDLGKLSGSCERPVDGLLGADFFRGRAIQIDFQAQKLRILKPNQIPTSGEMLPLQMRTCGMRVPIVVNGKTKQWVRLDTGCASPLQWVTAQVRSRNCNPKLAVGLAELSIPQTQTTVEIGQQKFNNIPTGLHEHPIFAGEAGLLGNGLLSRFSSVTIDARSGRVILQAGRAAP
jgi:hypothetical protein